MSNLLKLAGLSLALAMTVATVPELMQPAWAGNDKAAGQNSEQSRSFVIENMTCAACPITVKKAMQRVEGVKSVDIDYDSKTAVAVFDPALTNVDEIAAASTNVGYPATIVD